MAAMVVRNWATSKFTVNNEELSTAPSLVKDRADLISASRRGPFTNPKAFRFIFQWKRFDVAMQKWSGEKTRFYYLGEVGGE